VTTIPLLNDPIDLPLFTATQGIDLNYLSAIASRFNSLLLSQTKDVNNKFLILTLFCLAIFSRSSSAQSFKYDLPGNDYLPREKFIKQNYGFLPTDYRSILVSLRLVKWSEYLGPRDNIKKIAPNRLVWEVIRIYCRRATTGKIRYYFAAVDAVTEERLVKKRTQFTSDISLVSRWAAKDNRCKFPGRE
jgi:hypothetical protein